MVRTVKSNQDEDEIDGEEFTSSAPQVSSQKGVSISSFFCIEILSAS